MCETEARLDGKVAIVTGGSSGTGFEAARNLAQRGARVIIASRNEAKLKRARQRIAKTTGNKQVVYNSLDLASLKSVRRFTSDFISSGERLDILINNAGAVGLQDRLTEDGLSLTMQVNYFGTFLLTFLLVPLLKASAPSRVITGTAVSMYVGHLDFEHWNDIGRYNPVELLANSKLADALFSAELDRRLKGSGVTSNSFDPFVVKDTDIFEEMPELVRNISKLFIDIIGQPKEEVGQQLGYLAADPKFASVSGEHFKFCKNWIGHWLAGDDIFTKQLWEASKRAVNITIEEDWENDIGL